MHHARRHQGRGAGWPPKRKEKKDRGGASALNILFSGGGIVTANRWARNGGRKPTSRGERKIRELQGAALDAQQDAREAGARSLCVRCRVKVRGGRLRVASFVREASARSLSFGCQGAVLRRTAGCLRPARVELWSRGEYIRCQGAGSLSVIRHGVVLRLIRIKMSPACACRAAFVRRA